MMNLFLATSQDSGGHDGVHPQAWHPQLVPDLVVDERMVVKIVVLSRKMKKKTASLACSLFTVTAWVTLC